MLTKTKITLATALVLATFSGAMARGGGNDAYQTYLDEQYARSHPIIVPGTPPGIHTPGSAYGLASASPNARGSFAYEPVPHMRRMHEER